MCIRRCGWNYYNFWRDWDKINEHFYLRRNTACKRSVCNAYSACPSVTVVICQNGWALLGLLSNFSTVCRSIILAFWHHTSTSSQGQELNYKRGVKKMAIGRKSRIYLGNDARDSHSYYGLRETNRISYLPTYEANYNDQKSCVSYCLYYCFELKTCSRSFTVKLAFTS